METPRIKITIEDQTDKLKEAVKDGDNESAHAIYDNILHRIAKKHEPDVLDELDEIVSETTFWYA